MNSQTEMGARSVRSFAAFVVALAVVFAFVARQYVHRYAVQNSAAIAIYCSFLLLVILALAPAFEAVRVVIRARRTILLVGLWVLPYLIYAAGTHDFKWNALVRLIAIAGAAPLLYLVFPVRDLSVFTWQDALVATWMVAAVLLHGVAGIWSVPVNPARVNPARVNLARVNLARVNLDFMGRLFLIAVAASTWIFIRPVPGLGYRFALSKKVIVAAALNFGFFALIAIPAGLALRFTSWNPHWRGLAQFSLDYLEIFLFVALLEELFFRGFLQSLLSSTFRRAWHGQLVASCLFGLSHILHAPVPNWRYVALASMAGWFYGSAFRSSGTVFASALTHAMVDTAWRTWFGRI